LAIKIPPSAKTQDADDTPFDDTNVDFVAGDVQEAIEALEDKVDTSASPGFTWGKSGNVSAGAYLLNDTVPSNLAGRIIPIGNGKIAEVFVACQDNATCILSVEKRSGVSFIELLTISLTTQRNKVQAYTVSVSKGDELTTKVKTGSIKNPVIGIVIKGSLS